MEWTRSHPHHQFAYPLQYRSDGEDEEKHEATLKSDRYGSIRALLPSQSATALKEPIPSSLGDDGGSTMTFQSLSSLSMPQLDDATDFPPFYSSQNASFPDSNMLPQGLLPLPSSPSQQQELQFGGELPAQFASQYADFTVEPINYYRRPTPVLSIPMPMHQATARTSVDFFSEGIPALHSMHHPVPTLPPSFGSLEPQQQQQQLLSPVLEDQDEDFGNNMAQDMSSTIFRSSMTSADLYNSPRTIQTLPTDSCPARPSSSFGSTSPDYSPMVAPLGRPKQRGGGLKEPFTELAITHEPKFSPDKRKLCCVEGCASQARAFNRCKRHGGSKRCSSPGCTKSVQSRGLCIRHGGGSRCQESGCTRASQSHGKCKLHGGGRPCIVAGCEKKAHLKRLCRKHGGGTKCCVVDCEKWSQRQGMCMTHSKVVGPQPSGIGLVDDSAPIDAKSLHSSIFSVTDEIAM